MAVKAESSDSCVGNTKVSLGSLLRVPKLVLVTIERLGDYSRIMPDEVPISYEDALPSIVSAPNGQGTTARP
jgi:hypothetical protein